MKKALVRQSDGFVVNVILVGESYTAPEGHALLDPQNAAPGYTWDGAKFVAPPVAPSPPTLEERLTDLEKAIGAGGNPSEVPPGLAKRLDAIEKRLKDAGIA